MIWVALVVCGSALAYALGCAYLGRPPRLPVARAVYDDMVRIADQEREHNRRLTKIILRLKVSQQAHLPSRVEAREARVIDKIERAISHSKHAKDPRKRDALASWAERERALGQMSEEDIVDRLLNWDRVDTDEQDDDSNDLLS